MKFRLAVILTCTLAVLAAAADKTGAPAPGTVPSPAAAEKTITTPVWSPDARWKLDPNEFAKDTNIVAQLDGPRHEVMWGGRHKHARLRSGFGGSGRYVFMGYDAKGDRYHAVTTGAAGYLDGPFARARLYLSDYHGGHERAFSPDGRFFYYLADFYGQKVRALDFAGQVMSTLPKKGTSAACGESGNVYLTQGTSVSSIAVLSPGPEWKLLKTITAQGNRRFNGLGNSTAVDEKRERLYATTYGPKDFFVWYWDLKDGSVHGVLPNCSGKPGARGKSVPGPFEGTVVYNHGEIAWGPDDPAKRFLYMTRVDTAILHRLDLEKKIMAVLNVKEGRFVDTGSAEGSSAYSETPCWLPDGSFVGGIPWYKQAPHYRYFKRIK